MWHENINSRLKFFLCLEQPFHHDAEHHAACFRACAVLTQLPMESGEELFDMREYDDRMSDAQLEAIYGV